MRHPYGFEIIEAGGRRQCGIRAHCLPHRHAGGLHAHRGVGLSITREASAGRRESLRASRQQGAAGNRGHNALVESAPIVAAGIGYVQVNVVEGPVVLER